MAIFKCPHCGAGYELTSAHLSFQQRSYAVCQVCRKTMYSWSSRNVPRFKLLDRPKERPIKQAAMPNRPRRHGLYDLISWKARD
jgi:hypothetical protein